MIDRHITFAAAGFVISREHRDPLEQSGFAAAVFADDDGDRPVETQLEIIVQERKAEWIGLAVVNPRWLKPDPPQVRRRHPDVAFSLRTHAADASEPGRLPSFNRARNRKGDYNL